MAIPLLPKWVLPPTLPSVYDTESATALEMVAKLYGVISKIAEEYNAFVDGINKEIQSFTSSSNKEIENFKTYVEKRLCCKFEELDKMLAKMRLEMKQYTDNRVEIAFDVFGVTARVRGNNIVLLDATNERLRGLSIFGKTVQRWEPSPEYPAELQSVGDSGSITVTITDGHDKQTLTVGTPEGLPGIPVPNGGNYTDTNGQSWICDEIDLKRGVYVQRIHKMNLNGNETMTTGNSWAAGCCAVYTKDKNPEHVHGEMMCSFLPMHSNADLASGKFNVGIGTHGEPNLMVRFGADKTVEQTRELWKKAIEAGGAVYTILREPIERPLTAAEIAAYNKLHTYRPYTAISNTEGAEMMLEYVAVTQTYLENHFHSEVLRIATEMINAAIKNGEITVGLEYNEETEEANIIVGGGL